jgi:hypothetical protein
MHYKRYLVYFTTESGATNLYFSRRTHTTSHLEQAGRFDKLEADKIWFDNHVYDEGLSPLWRTVVREVKDETPAKQGSFETAP